jgi:hypothetical protein
MENKLKHDKIIVRILVKWYFIMLKNNNYENHIFLYIC